MMGVVIIMTFEVSRDSNHHPGQALEGFSALLVKKDIS